MARKPSRPSAPSGTIAQRVARVDGFVNAVTGYGTTVDRTARATVRAIRDTWATQPALETLYYEDDICACIVDALVEDSLRQGIELGRDQDGEDADDDGEEVKRQASQIQRAMRRLGALAHVSRAAKWGRLYGGAVVVLFMEDGSHGEPLKLGRKVEFLRVFDRWELSEHRRYEDPAHPKYGQTMVWRVHPRGSDHGQQLEVHESRILRFEGIDVSSQERLRQNGWTVSVLVRVYEIVRDAAQNWRSVASMMSQSTQPIFKLRGLAHMVANGQDNVLVERMTAANLGRSALNAVMIDAEGEDFRYEDASLSGLDTLLDKTWQRLAAAASMPVTRLMGTSPAGMNATGESDTRMWYDRVQAYRENVLGPQIERLVHVIAASQGDTSPTEWVVDWPSLWQMSPTEEAAYRQVVANTDKVYIDAGVLTPEEVAIARFSGRWSPETVIDVEAREQTGEPPAPQEPAPPPAQVPDVEQPGPEDEQEGA